MGDLRPLGSERLQGTDKLRRIMEIARYNEAPKQEINELSTTNYTITLADGNTYAIVKEKAGYIIKRGLNESTLDYSEPMKQRKYFRSYSEAMKKLNLMAGELNRVNGNEYGIPLIGEQAEPKKKFVLKSKPVLPKKEDEATPPPPPAAPAPAAPAPEAPAVEEPAMGDEMGADTSMGGDDMSNSPAMGGGDMETNPEDENMDMAPGDEGVEPDVEDDMGGDEEPIGLKMIQKLTGKLSQKIRSFDKDKGLDSQDIKYVVNSILSAIDMSKLDEDDKEEILNKIEDYDEYGAEEEGDLDLDSETDFGMGMDDTESESNPEDDMSLGDEMPAPAMGESVVESVLSKYFDIKPSEKLQLEEKRKKEFLNKKLNRVKTINEISTMSESIEQMMGATNFLNENPNAKFIGKTNKENLVFMVNGKQVKVTQRGRVL
jgi:hypothetical protein